MVLARSERLFTVTGCRAMGKSSLVRRRSPELEREGIRVIELDLANDVGKAATLDEWFAGLRRAISGELLEPSDQNRFLERVPAPETGRSRWLGALLEAVTEVTGKATLLVLDEFDYVGSLDYGQQLLAVWRAALQRDSAPSAARASVCFLGLRPPNELADPRSGPASPWGKGVVMSDFESDSETIESIASALHDPSTSQALSERILWHTGGQPLLTMLLADEVRRHEVKTTAALDERVQLLLAAQRVHRTNLFLQIRNALLAEHHRDIYAALTTWRGMLDGRRGPRLAIDVPGATLLRDCGLLRSTVGGLEIKAKLLARHFDLDWVHESLDHLANHPSAHFAPRRSTAASRKRICVFNTGGTIGMVRRDGEVRPPDDAHEFLSNFPYLEAIAEIHFVPLLNLDSVNVTPSDWSTIAGEIYRRRNEFDGFVVAHGTDTMAWSASGVAFALGRNLSFPVVFTGAQTTPDVPHGDAYINMVRACRTAIAPIPEVVICFNDHVFRGVRAQKINELAFDAFASPSYPALARITETLVLSKECIRVAEPDVPDITLQADFASGILMIQLSPGLEPDFYRGALELRSDDGARVCQGIIIQTLGAGNVASIPPHTVLPLIADAIALGIPVVVSSPFPWDPAPARRYAPAKAPMELGAISSGEMTAAAAAAKFRWALAQTTTHDSPEARLAHVRKIMICDYVGEGIGHVIDHLETPSSEAS